MKGMLWSVLNDKTVAVNHSGFAGLQAFAFILLVLSFKHANHTVSSHSKHDSTFLVCFLVFLFPPSFFPVMNPASSELFIMQIINETSHSRSRMGRNN